MTSAAEGTAATPATVAILGLGLIGGSLARDLAARGWRVLAADADAAALGRAVASGVVAGALDTSLAGVREAGVVVLATPLDAMAALLGRLAPHLRADAVVTDVGSCKGLVADAAVAAGLGDRFVGSHPLAGDHRSGWDASREGMFAGARVFVTPVAATPPAVVDRVLAWWGALGATGVVLDARAHDAQMAWVSHLPQVASSAVAAALAAAGEPPAALGRGGKDVTRLAGSSPEMWTAIALGNAEPIAATVRALRAQLDAFEAALAARDGEALRRWFAAGRDWAG